MFAEWVRDSQFQSIIFTAIVITQPGSAIHGLVSIVPSYKFRVKKFGEFNKFELNHLIKCMQFPTHPRVLTDQVAG
jgi:hypothetical protein